MVESGRTGEILAETGRGENVLENVSHEAIIFLIFNVQATAPDMTSDTLLRPLRTGP
jgi:hypothetical protein